MLLKCRFGVNSVSAQVRRQREHGDEKNSIFQKETIKKTKAIKLKVLYFVAFVSRAKKNNLNANYKFFASGCCCDNRDGAKNVRQFDLTS